MQNMQLERKNYFYPVNMTYFVNSKHFPNMIGQKWHTPLSMRICVDPNDNFRFCFFQYIFPIYQHWNIGLKNSGSLGPVTNMYYDGSQDFELEEDKLYVDFIIFTLLELHICIIMIMTC